MQHNQSDAPNPAVSNPGDAPAPEPSVYDRARVGNIQQLERFCKQYLEDIIAKHGFPAKVQIHTPPGNGRHSTHDMDIKMGYDVVILGRVSHSLDINNMEQPFLQEAQAWVDSGFRVFGFGFTTSNKGELLIQFYRLFQLAGNVKMGYGPLNYETQKDIIEATVVECFGDYNFVPGVNF